MKRPNTLSVVVVCSLLVVVCASGSAIGGTSKSASWPHEIKRTSVSQRDRVLLNQAMVNRNRDDVTILVACEQGRTDAVRVKLESLRAHVLVKVDAIAYITAILRQDAFQKVLDIPEVVDAAIDGWANYTSVLDTESQLMKWNWDPRLSIPPDYSHLPVLSSAALTAENPYLPTRDIGAPQFIGQHPKFDGRGTTIAFVENTPYWAHPVFRGAKGLDGTPVSKFAGVLNASDEEAKDDEDVVSMKDIVIAGADGFFPGPGNVYRAPHPGTYRFGTFQSATHETYAVLWEQKEGLVWIDTNQDDSFADDKPVRDVNKEFTYLYLPDTRYIRAAVMGWPVVVAMDAGNEAIHIYASDRSKWHTTAVLSTVAGKSFLSGQADGVAPGARLLPVDQGHTTKLHNLISAFLLAAETPSVDLITTSIISDDFQNDGDSFLTRMLSRISFVYQKLIFVGTQNAGPGLGQSGEWPNGNQTIGVGGYVAPETMTAFTGVKVPSEDRVGLVTSSGPSANGALKPDFLTPPLTLMAYPCSGEEDNPHKAFLKTSAFQIPACYGAGEGVSFTGPIAAAGAALLISAAKQTGVSYGPESLRWAMRASAKYLPNYGAYEQGTGLLQIEAAWKLLQTSVRFPEITSIGPVKHLASRFLIPPNVGPGIYEREGWIAGQLGERTIKFERHSGPEGPGHYEVSWLGNDGTFKAPASLELPLGQVVQLAVKIRPSRPGTHSAILNLLDRSTGYPIYQTMLTIVAAERLTKGNDFSVQERNSVDFQSYRSYFIDVPANTTALRVDLQVLQGNVRLRANNPSPMHDFDRAGKFPYLEPIPGSNKPVGVWTQFFAQPIAGVWEFRIENDGDMVLKSGDSTIPPAEFSLRVAALRAEVRALDNLKAMGTGIDTQVRFTNLYGPLLGADVNAELASLYRAKAILPASGDPRIFEIHVPKGSTMLDVKITHEANAIENLDLYLYDCTGGHCYLWDVGTWGERGQSLIARNPRPGLWKALVCSESPVTRDIVFTYSDAYTDPSLGSIVGHGEGIARRVGEEWQDSFTIRTTELPAVGRELAAVVEVVDVEAERREKKNPIYDLNNPVGGPWNRPASTGLEILGLQRADMRALSFPCMRSKCLDPR